MNLLLDPEHEALHRELRALVEREVVPRAAEHDRQQVLDRALIQTIADAGLLAGELEVEHGGRGLDALGLGLWMEELGRGCSSVRSLATVHGMVAHVIARWGRPALREAWLPRLGRGQWLGALAVTEPEVGSDLASVRTRAERDGEDFVLNGDKHWITCGEIADCFLVLAAAEGGPVAVLLRRDTPGLEIESIRDMLGTRGSMLAALRMRGCRVPADSVLGRPGTGLAWVVSAALDHGRFTVGWGSVGIAQACLEASVRYAQRRVQFGVPIIEHQLVRRLISEMTANTRAARQLCVHAARLRAVGDPQSMAETSVAKHFAAKVAMQAAHDAVQIHGAQGCSSERAVERYFRDAKVMEIIEGSNEMHQLHIVDLASSDLAELEVDAG